MVVAVVAGCTRTAPVADRAADFTSLTWPVDREHPEREVLFGVIDNQCGRDDVAAQLAHELDRRSVDATLATGRIKIDGWELVVKPRFCDSEWAPLVEVRSDRPVRADDAPGVARAIAGSHGTSVVTAYTQRVDTFSLIRVQQSIVTIETYGADGLPVPTQFASR